MVRIFRAPIGIFFGSLGVGPHLSVLRSHGRARDSEHRPFRHCCLGPARRIRIVGRLAKRRANFSGQCSRPRTNLAVPPRARAVVHIVRSLFAWPAANRLTADRVWMRSQSSSSAPDPHGSSGPHHRHQRSPPADNSAPAARKSGDRTPHPLRHSPVDLLLCTDKDQNKVDYAAGGLDQQLFDSCYLVALPKPEQLEQLIETDRAAWEQHHPQFITH